MIHPSVKAAFPKHSAMFEGRVPGMYCDILGLITCGQGNLIDPISAAERLPWALADGSKADLAQVRADWHKLKDNWQHYAKRHWKFALADTKCRLTDAAIDALVAAKLEENAVFLKSHYFEDFASFPADAQLGLLSMAWAVGPGFPLKFKNFTQLVLKGDWAGTIAKDASGGYAAKIRETGNPGVVPRNAANRLCFSNAALASKGAFDLEHLFWPGIVPPTSSAMAQEHRPIADQMLDALSEAEVSLTEYKKNPLYRGEAVAAAAASMDGVWDAIRDERNAAMRESE